MKSLQLTLVALAVLSANACYGITHTFSGTMDVLQAGTNGGFGAGTGTGTGTISGDYNAATNEINYTLTWEDLIAPVTNLHFHLGAPGVSGGVELGVPGPWSSPYVNSAVVDTEAKEANLLAGDWYVNVHTDGNAGGFPGGEIRGQVIVRPIPEPTTACLALVACASVVSLRRKR